MAKIVKYGYIHFDSPHVLNIDGFRIETEGVEQQPSQWKADLLFTLGKQLLKTAKDLCINDPGPQPYWWTDRLKNPENCLTSKTFEPHEED